jgi:hypothetical protein
MLVWERDAERNLETSLWIYIVRGHYALRIVGDLGVGVRSTPARGQERMEGE